MKVSEYLAQEQRQRITQKQRQSLEILSMDTSELEEFLQAEYLENPLLEYPERKSRFSDAEPTLKEMAALELPSLSAFFGQQLATGRYSQEELACMEFLMECLDEHGFLRESPQELARFLHCSQERVEFCLTELKKLEPLGCFASDLSECLLLQLKEKDQEDDILKAVIRDHLADVASGHISSITRALGISTKKARECILKIRELNPRPLQGFSAEQTHYIVPDVTARRAEDGHWQVSINDQWTGDCRISDFYLHMLEEARDAELAEYFREKLKRAREILEGIEKRRQTICQVTEKLLEYQGSFLEGKGELVPFTMEQAAQELGIHPSTISRCVKGKYLEVPAGTVSLRQLFTASGSKGSEAVPGAKDASAEEVKRRIKTWIAGEDREKPFSDQELCDRLAVEGILISRRAVAKYRELLGIPGSYARRL